jgi:hypothetical protein
LRTLARSCVVVARADRGGEARRRLLGTTKARRVAAGEKAEAVDAAKRSVETTERVNLMALTSVFATRERK